MRFEVCCIELVEAIHGLFTKHESTSKVKKRKTQQSFTMKYLSLQNQEIELQKLLCYGEYLQLSAFK